MSSGFAAATEASVASAIGATTISSVRVVMPSA
jgi:hypothetical protein